MPMAYDGRRKRARIDLDAMSKDDLVILAREKGLPAVAAAWKRETLIQKIRETM